jgi:peptide/nickel transport system permease protein
MASQTTKPDTLERGLTALSRRPIRPSLQSPLLQMLGQRVLMGLVLLFVVSALSFVLVSLTPGDAARTVLGIQAPPEAYEKLRHALGLDLPLYEQYWRWAGHVLHGDLGSSLFTDETVTRLVSQRLPITASLLIGTLLVSTLVGVGLGLTSAVRGGVLGRAVDALALVGFSLPAFWVGAVLISIFAVKLGWLPATGYVPFADSPGGWLRSLVLPVVALSLGPIASIAKQTRDAMLDVLSREYIRMAWANGISARSIFFKHALKNTSMRIVTVLGVEAVGLLGGAIVIENVFGLPGLGSLAVNATTQHDLPVVLGLVMCFTVMVIVLNFFIDVAYAYLDPRVRAR